MTDTKAKRSRGKRVTPEARLIDSHVGKRLRDLRRLKGISQTELAEGVDLTFQQIQKYENGSNRVSLSMLVAIAKVLSYSPGHLARELLLGLEVANTDDIPAETALSRDAMRLVRSFEQLQNHNLRRRVIELVQTLVEEASLPQSGTDAAMPPRKYR